MVSNIGGYCLTGAFIGIAGGYVLPLFVFDVIYQLEYEDGKEC